MKLASSQSSKQNKSLNIKGVSKHPEGLSLPIVPSFRGQAPTPPTPVP